MKHHVKTMSSGAQAQHETSGSLWTPNFVLGMVVNFLIMVNYFIPMVVVANYAMDEYGASESLAGMVASVFIIGALVSRIASGAIMAKFGARQLLAAGIVVETVFSVMYFLDLGIYPLILLRFVHGLSYGAASSSVGTAVTAIIPSAHKGEGVGYYMLSHTLGTAVGPFLGIAISQQFGIHGVFAGCAITAAGALIALIGFRPDRSIGKLDARIQRERGARALIEPSAVPIAVVACLMFFGYSAVLTFLTPFATEVGLVGASSFFFVSYAFAMFVSRLFTGKLFDRYGAFVVMVPSFFLAAAGFVLIGMAANGFALLTGAALLGLGIGTIQSCGLTIAVQRANIRRLSYANSTYYALTDAGVGLGPLILGAIIPMLGYRGLYLSMAGIVALAFAWYLVVERRGQRKARA